MSEKKGAAGEQLSHVDESGNLRMVDVSGKDETDRRALARTEVLLAPATMDLLVRQALPKGDVLAVAKVAGILAAKRTHELIPLCHPLMLSYVDVSFEIDQEGCRVVIFAEAHTSGRTGLEMEALMAAQVAALTIYDMCKAVQKNIVIADCRLLRKSGGKSGLYEAPELKG
ncbi:cyclic pyranopterin monophosphate synthase MoaC [Paucidesulfovibrio longus]|uniref:cyclic pyranopterin monophosphate synthase MoaC n=1 Tax=Paucidesulfovibrio longus TaxID=889 RepID=UPI0003B7B806|nr:cyclic pyranopterin monophosphate synthase MoaC [Paucidesulfovibrio longus]